MLTPNIKQTWHAGSREPLPWCGIRCVTVADGDVIHSINMTPQVLYTDLEGFDLWRYNIVKFHISWNDIYIYGLKYMYTFLYGIWLGNEVTRLMCKSRFSKIYTWTCLILFPNQYNKAYFYLYIYAKVTNYP